jgi:hypothetical protein
MSTPLANEFVRRAEQLYASRLRPMLEPAHLNEFVAIEPDSGDFFLGKTVSDAVQAAHRRYHDRLVHTMRVGHSAALHFGVQM